MKKKLALLNLSSAILVIIINALSQIHQWNGTTIGRISADYDNLFTPAPYAFSIWGLIFIALLLYGFFQVKRAFFNPEEEDPFIEQTGYWFTTVNVLNAGWIIAFTYDQVLLSVIMMLIMLFGLIKIILNTNMERWDAPVEIIAFVWWPICLYTGWITVATIANISVLLTKWELKGSELNQIIWTMVVITVAVFINALIINMRNMREFALVGAWALFAIFIRHIGEIDALAYYALCGTIVLLVLTGMHGYKNRATNPFSKLRERF